MAKLRKIALKTYIRNMVLHTTRSLPWQREWLNLANKLEAFEEHVGETLYTYSFTAMVMERFIYYLRTRRENYKVSTVNGFISCTGSALRRAARDGNKVNWGFTAVRLVQEEATSIYLTNEEIERIFRLKKISREAQAIRDMFVIACYSGMRWSDVKELTADNFQNGVIRRKTIKTGAVVEVPIHWMTQAILDKRKGELPRVKSQQAYNKMVKRICRLAGISDKILYEQTHGTKVVRKMVPKHGLVTSHTSRRSFATNAYLAGIPVARIMLITGHTTEQSFFQYIRIGRHENAKELASHQFFRGK